MNAIDNGKQSANGVVIETASVSLSIVQVGKKQMTLSIFRQLPARNLIDAKTLEFVGTPWGHVNYWWDTAIANTARKIDLQYAQRQFLHILFEYDGTLYRYQHRVEKGVSGDDERSQRFFALQDALLALPQLFIAV